LLILGNGAETRLLVDALRVGAAALDAQIDELAAAGSVDAARLGVIAAMLDTHLRIEESVLLPALTGLPGVDPSLLAADVRAYLEGAGRRAGDHRRTAIARGGDHPRVFARHLPAGKRVDTDRARSRRHTDRCRGWWHRRYTPDGEQTLADGNIGWCPAARPAASPPATAAPPT
jgi:hypothetical protein